MVGIASATLGRYDQLSSQGLLGDSQPGWGKKLGLFASGFLKILVYALGPLSHTSPLIKKAHARYRNTVRRDTPSALAISAVDSPVWANLRARAGRAFVEPGYRPR